MADNERDNRDVIHDDGRHEMAGAAAPRDEVAGAPRDEVAATPHLWGIVLAGSDGPIDATRSPGARSHAARHRPPQYSPVGSPLSLLRQTIDRASRLIPTERLVVVLARGHSRYYASELPTVPAIKALIQPAYRGSAVEIYLPLLKIAARDRNAIAVVMPSAQLIDHDRRFMNHVAQAARAVAMCPQISVVIGARPLMPDASRSWIEPGEPLAGLERFPLRAVRRFVHQPTPRDAEALYDGGGLLSTLVMVANAQTLIQLGRQYLPDVLDTLEPLANAFDGPEERLLSEAVYETMPYASVSREILSRREHFAVLPVGDVMWSDWARPALHALAS